MPRSLTIGSRVFEYPDAGDPAGWGKEATDAFEALVQQISDVSGPNDITKTQTNLNNNASGDIIGMFFDPVNVRGGTVNYTVYRATTGLDMSEYGVLQVRFTLDESTNNKFGFTQISTGDAGITFGIKDDGQFTYQTTDATTGIIYFNGKAFEV